MSNMLYEKYALSKFGSAEQKEKYLAPAIRGEIVFAISNAEHQAGTDMRKVASSCRKSPEI